MNNSVVPNDHKEGLVASCFDLFESYGNDLLEAIEYLKPQTQMYFSFGAPSNKKSKEELEKEKESWLKSSKFLLAFNKILSLVENTLLEKIPKITL